MKTKNINTEINLYSIAMIILNNRIKFFLIIIIGISLSIIHEIYKKPFKPIYEISVKFEEISLLKQQQYDELNNNLQLTSSFPTYLKEFENQLDLKNLGNENLLDAEAKSKMIKNLFISKFFNNEKNYIKYESIDSKLLLSFFVRFLIDELESSEYNQKIKSLEIIETPVPQSNIGNFRDYFIQIKLISDDGDLQNWEEFFLKQYKKTNENVRIFLIDKLTTDIQNVEKNYDYFLDELMTFGQYGAELKNISNKLFKRQLYFLKVSPLNDSESFSSSNFKNNSTNIKTINASQKNLKIEIKILISILISLLVGFILIYFGWALKKPE
jgi:hypothetical protein